MATGQGKYDEFSTKILQAVSADTVVVMVIDGSRGNGFSVSSTDPNIHRKLPDILRHMADQLDMEAS